MHFDALWGCEVTFLGLPCSNLGDNNANLFTKNEIC
jgi:hypothetical protein